MDRHRKIQVGLILPVVKPEQGPVGRTSLVGLWGWWDGEAALWRLLLRLQIQVCGWKLITKMTPHINLIFIMLKSGHLPFPTVGVLCVLHSSSCACWTPCSSLPPCWTAASPQNSVCVTLNLWVLQAAAKMMDFSWPSFSPVPLLDCWNFCR